MQTLDWIVIALYGLGMLVVGWYFSRRTKTSDDYMLGGRRMKPWAVGVSLFATMLSAISYLATPGEVIKYGPMLMSGMAAYPLVFLVVGWVLIPSIMKLKITSAYELLEVRLGVSVRVLASLIFLSMRLMWMAVIIYLCAMKVIVPIMGWSESAALWVSVIMGVITLIYTSMGGLRAVVFTDVVQTFILFGGAILSIALIAKHLGGIGALFPHELPDGWVEWRLFDTKARWSFGTAAITFFLWWICTAGSDQMAIQRYLATRDAKSARKMFLTSTLTDCTVMAFLALLGLALLAYFRANQHLLPAGEVIEECADKLFPHFIVIALPAGISGLVIAGLMAAAMSSLSSGINSSGLVISKDLIGRFRKREISELSQVKLARIISFAVGVAVVAISLLVGNVRGNLTEITYKTVNLLAACLFVPFFMALFVPRATEMGTFVGTLGSVVVAVLIGFSAEFFGRKIPFLWIMPGSFAVGVLVSTLISLLLPNNNK